MKSILNVIVLPTGREDCGVRGACSVWGVCRSKADQHGHPVHPDGDHEGSERLLHIYQPPPTTPSSSSGRDLCAERQPAEILLCHFQH